MNATRIAAYLQLLAILAVLVPVAAILATGRFGG
jgi:hypothetical protein